MSERCFVSDLIPQDELKEVISRTGAGVETIRFSVGMNLDDFEHQMECAKEELKAYGNPGLTLHGPFLDLNPMSFDRLIRQATMERFQQAYEAAIILGAEKITYHSGMVPSANFLEGWAERMIDFWNEFLDGKAGIRVCMENVLDQEPSALLKVAEEVTHPEFGLCLDIGHAHCYSPHSVLEWAEMLAGHIGHVHIHDNDGTRDSHNALGEGTIPLEQLLPVLKKQNPEVTWTVECREEKDILSSLDYLKKVL